MRKLKKKNRNDKKELFPFENFVRVSQIRTSVSIEFLSNRKKKKKGSPRMGSRAGKCEREGWVTGMETRGRALPHSEAVKLMVADLLSLAVTLAQRQLRYSHTESRETRKHAYTGCEC